VAGYAVAAAADGELQSGLAGEGYDARDVRLVCDPDDDRRPAVDIAVEDGAALVVPGVLRSDHPPLEGRAELGDEGGLGGVRVHEDPPSRI
jgi:hypothetical protein